VIKTVKKMGGAEGVFVFILDEVLQLKLQFQLG